MLQSYKLLLKQHTFSYMFTLIAHNIDTPVISFVKQTKLNVKIAIICIYIYIYLLNTYK